MEKLVSFVELEVLTHHHLSSLLRVYDETSWWECGRENSTLPSGWNGKRIQEGGTVPESFLKICEAM